MTERRIVTEARGQKVLVTGARGFLGRAAISALASGGWEVHGLASSAVVRPAAEVVWHSANLLQPGVAAALVREVAPSHLLHLAWAPNRGIYESMANFHWVEASLGLLRAFAAAGGRRTVFVGSCAEYLWGSEDPLDESAPLTRENPYAAAKVALGQLFCDACSFSSLSGAWARPFFLFGPSEPRERLVASVIGSLLMGEPARTTHGEQVRDYLYVRDAADALVAILASEIEGSVNVASGRGLRLRDLVNSIARQLEGEDLVEFGALEASEGEAPKVVATVERLREEVGWRPSYDLERAIEETVTWWARRMTH